MGNLATMLILSDLIIWHFMCYSLIVSCTGILSQIRTKLRDWAIWLARAGCYSQAALYSNDSKTLYTFTTDWFDEKSLSSALSPNNGQGINVVYSGVVNAVVVVGEWIANSRNLQMSL